MEHNPRSRPANSAATPSPAPPPANGLQRTAAGQFSAGYSGNPAGRPRSESAALRLKLAERAEDVIQAVLDAALNGDMSAAKMILDRLVPPLRPHSETVSIQIEEPASPSTAAAAILNAAVAGRIPPDAGVQLLSAAANLGRIIETTELKARLEALERAVTPQKPTTQKRP